MLQATSFRRKTGLPVGGRAYRRQGPIARSPAWSPLCGRSSTHCLLHLLSSYRPQPGAKRKAQRVSSDPRGVPFRRTVRGFLVRLRLPRNDSTGRHSDRSLERSDRRSGGIPRAIDESRSSTATNVPPGVKLTYRHSDRSLEYSDRRSGGIPRTIRVSDSPVVKLE